MKVIVVGNGIQGKKRKLFLGKNEFICSVDPYCSKSKFKLIKNVPIDSYDTVFVCTPESEKIKIIEYCIKNKKNCLIEKPFPNYDKRKIKSLEKLANKNNIVCYTAYNHRFEPFIKKIKNILDDNKIGKIYSCKIFYGNGTSRLVKKSNWKDRGLGVVLDLFPHLLDMCNYWFGLKSNVFKNFHMEKFENKSPDYAVINSKIKKIFYQLEMTYCMWKNDFSCDILGKDGSIHMTSLCKWDTTVLKIRTRVLPSGKPKEKVFSIKMKDPTWKLELNYFKQLIRKKQKNNFNENIWINDNLNYFKKNRN
jgi:scyllo-inositol 2-dehydrogenase (NADP+)